MTCELIGISVHDDTDASIEKGVEDSNLHLLCWDFGSLKEGGCFLSQIGLEIIL